MSVSLECEKCVFQRRSSAPRERQASTVAASFYPLQAFLLASLHPCPLPLASVNPFPHWPHSVHCPCPALCPPCPYPCSSCPPSCPFTSCPLPPCPNFIQLSSVPLPFSPFRLLVSTSLSPLLTFPSSIPLFHTFGVYLQEPFFKQSFFKHMDR